MRVLIRVKVTASTLWSAGVLGKIARSSTEDGGRIEHADLACRMNRDA